jgi:hypothetical protein
LLRGLLNNWKISQVTTIGSGRPVNAQVSGDANADGNIGNDRLPGSSRNSLVGPDYASTELRVSRQMRLTARYRLELKAEGFNVLNRNNKKLTTSDNGVSSTAADFQYGTVQQGPYIYPASYVKNSTFMQPQSSYIPRQIQFSMRLRF